MQIAESCTRLVLLEMSFDKKVCNYIAYNLYRDQGLAEQINLDKKIPKKSESNILYINVCVEID